MPETRPTGRGQEIVELPPAELVCGHETGPHKVTLGYQPDPDGVRRRSYRCNQCGTITWN